MRSTKSRSSTTNMLESLVQCKLPVKFLIIQDTEKDSAQDLFVAFLKNHNDSAVDTCTLICFENPPEFYLKFYGIEKIIKFNFLTDPWGWNDKPVPKTDLSVFTSNSSSLSETVFFIDSLSFLIEYHGFYSVYKNLNKLKKAAKKVICLAHGDLFSSSQLEELKSLSTCVVECRRTINKERLFDIFYRKLGGKIINQQEIVSSNTDFKVCTRVKVNEVSMRTPNVKGIMEKLTTFKLGLEMSERERMAKNELILPFLRNEEKASGTGEIIYLPEVEDDPDDDLDI